MVRALLQGRKTQTRRRDTPAWDRFLHRFEQGESCLLWVKENTWRETPPGSSPYAADRPEHTGALRTSLFMPRALCRIALSLTNVRRQRLQDIDEADARAEGVGEAPDPIAAYHEIWSSLHGRNSWDGNPDVMAFTFQVNAKLGASGTFFPVSHV